MKVNTNDTNSIFEKSFTKYPFNFEKKMMSDRFNKSFSFSIDSPLFKKSCRGFDILYLRGLQFKISMTKLTKSFNILYQASTHPKIFMKLTKQG